ncbi:hypothetical protein XELAEV_18006514mg [Xenopus laevis]|uniref:Uncharacterized protein n=1 Tax=Xenopus laevis TaxID=8355 RepID=A0A974DYS0_XENLA|nr:hypothetical protein XELAEV_18006514mg [Xenopus laevis]
MKTFLVMAVFLIFLSWLSDGTEGLSSGKKIKLQRAFFTKRSTSTCYEENPRYNCVISSCLPSSEECTMGNLLKNNHQDKEKRDIQEIRCVVRFALCASKCLKNWKKRTPLS